MSMDICCRCDAPVDTDFDCECYVPYPAHSVKAGWDMCLCERCREREQDELDHQASQDRS